MVHFNYVNIMTTHNTSSLWFTLDYKIAFFFPA
ncbi:TPA: tryptophanase leader peptide [Vibrio vulnificus]|nr:tryptophanase leader peptide [Vibrio vulnificus]